VASSKVAIIFLSDAGSIERSPTQRTWMFSLIQPQDMNPHF
jgi:hypothetical protein